MLIGYVGQHHAGLPSKGTDRPIGEAGGAV